MRAPRTEPRRVGRAAALAVAVLAPLVACSRDPDAEGRLQLTAAYRGGDPVALAVSSDGARLWSQDGALVTEWDLTGEPEATRAFALDAAAFSLVHARGRLFAAGGSAGLWVVDLAPARPRARRVAQRQDLVCTDVEVVDGLLLATFAAAQGSRLAVFDARSLRALGEATLPAGVAWAVAARGEHAWVALGEGGLARVDLSDPRDPRAEQGPDERAFRHLCGPVGWPIVVRDVAVSSTHVYATADFAGLVAVPLDAPWSPKSPRESTVLRLEGDFTYASRVAVEGDLVVVGTNQAPVRGQEGAPYGLFGWMDARLHVGGMTDASYSRGVGQGLLVLRRTPDALQLQASVTGNGGWRTLALRGGRSFEQHIGQGWIVRDVQSDPPEVVRSHRPVGYAATDGGLGLSDPRLVLFGSDSAGSIAPGWLRRSAKGAIEAAPATRAPPPLGLTVGAQWIEAATGEEWCLAGGGLGWLLVRVDAADPGSSAAWPLQTSADPDGALGLGYLGSTLDGDLLLLSQARSRWGLLALSASELTARARAAPPGTSLEARVAARAQTHEVGVDRLLFTWPPGLYDARDGRRVAVVPAGLDRPGMTGPARARTLLFDVSRAAQGVVEELAEFLAPRSGGHALAVELAERDGRTYAFVLDFTWGVDVLDVTAPEAPALVGGWAAPISHFDLQRSNVVDLVLDRRDDGGLDVLLAAGRLGILRLDASDPRRFDLPVREVVETPGWALGLCLREVDGQRVLVVGDQKGGLREYRLR